MSCGYPEGLSLVAEQSSEEPILIVAQNPGTLGYVAHAMLGYLVRPTPILALREPLPNHRLERDDAYMAWYRRSRVVYEAMNETALVESGMHGSVALDDLDDWHFPLAILEDDSFKAACGGFTADQWAVLPFEGPSEALQHNDPVASLNQLRELMPDLREWCHQTLLDTIGRPSLGRHAWLVFDPSDRAQCLRVLAEAARRMIHELGSDHRYYAHLFIGYPSPVDRLARLAEALIEHGAHQELAAYVRHMLAAAADRKNIGLRYDDLHRAGSFAIEALALSGTEHLPLLIEYLQAGDPDHDPRHMAIIERVLAKHGWSQATFDLLLEACFGNSDQAWESAFETWCTRDGLAAWFTESGMDRPFMAAALVNEVELGFDDVARLSIQEFDLARGSGELEERCRHGIRNLKETAALIYGEADQRVDEVVERFFKSLRKKLRADDDIPDEDFIVLLRDPDRALPDWTPLPREELAEDAVALVLVIGVAARGHQTKRTSAWLELRVGDESGEVKRVEASALSDAINTEDDTLVFIEPDRGDALMYRFGFERSGSENDLVEIGILKGVEA